MPEGFQLRSVHVLLGGAGPRLSGLSVICEGCRRLWIQSKHNVPLCANIFRSFAFACVAAWLFHVCLPIILHCLYKPQLLQIRSRLLGAIQWGMRKWRPGSHSACVARALGWACISHQYHTICNPQSGSLARFAPNPHVKAYARRH